MLEKMKLFTTTLGEVYAVFSAPRIPDLCAYANYSAYPILPLVSTQGKVM